VLLDIEQLLALRSPFKLGSSANLIWPWPLLLTGVVFVLNFVLGFLGVVEVVFSRLVIAFVKFSL
jgi:hypothetical protein